ncbi:MAG: redox-regulated ATPase YchF [bacterium]
MTRASLSIGFVGLPNVGKSSLFNAISKQTVAAENYPFCTIEPHVGTVALSDTRVDKLATLMSSEKTIYSTVDFVDIAGLVKGASKGEGLGNQFLSNIRETGVICHVLRCFDDPDVVHVDGKVNPIEDLDVVITELILADLQVCEKALEKVKKQAKTGDAQFRSLEALLLRVQSHLSGSKLLSLLSFSEGELQLLKPYAFLTLKPFCLLANVLESDLGGKNKWVSDLLSIANDYGVDLLEICVSLELELAVLTEVEKKDYLASLGVVSSGLDQLVALGFDLLNLQCFLTAGIKETRSWVIPKGCKAPVAASVIHTDFERGFIRANVISYDQLMKVGSFKEAKEKGLLRQEGKDYVMQEGDVVEFLVQS